MLIKFSLCLTVFLHGAVSVAASPTGVASDLDSSLPENKSLLQKQQKLSGLLGGLEALKKNVQILYG